MMGKDILAEIAGGISAGIAGTANADSTLGQSRYDFVSRTFPLELGSDNSFNGHYMVININIQEASKMSGVATGAGLGYSVLPGEYSKTDVLRYNIDAGLGFGAPSFTPFAGFSETTVGKYIPGAAALDRLNFASRPRFTRRIAESIALYMPNSELTFTDVHAFEDISLTKFATTTGRTAAMLAGAAVGGTIGRLFGAAGVAAGGAGGASFATQAWDTVEQVVGNIAQVSGFPINPKVEVLFSNTSQRSFAFDFLFAPSSEAESEALFNIIRTLRFHAAPELQATGGISSFFYIPPAEFDITFYNRGAENTKIPRINTCVLEQVDYSVSPTGVYSTFSNGYPVAIRLVLRFKETEVAHKLRISQGF